MENFILHNPTKVFFGKGVVEKLHENIKNYGSKVLFLIGKGSVMRYGYYDIVLEQLKKSRLKYIEYKGIRPNPVIEDINYAVQMATEEKIDLIVALGGGSVIDSAKIISLAAANRKDAWEIMTKKVAVDKQIPVISILTLAGTGSEMNAAAVVQNLKQERKIGYVNSLMYPKETYLDPEFTCTVANNHTSYGIVDLVAHALEAFFADGDATLSDKFVGAIVQEAMYNAPLVLAEPKSYKYRSRIMWAATCALNGITSCGRKTSGDWAVHEIGHAISFLYDTPHGATLSIAYPAWLKFHLTKNAKRISQLGRYLFNENNISAEKTILKIETFFKSMSCPTKLTDLGFIEYDKNKILNLMIKNNVTGLNHKLEAKDLTDIVDLMYF